MVTSTIKFAVGGRRRPRAESRPGSRLERRSDARHVSEQAQNHAGNRAGQRLLALGYTVLAAPDHDHHAAHPGDPVKQEEHTALFDLVDDKARHPRRRRQRRLGRCPRPGTRAASPVPGPRVVIPKERTVTVAGSYDKDRVDWLRVDGTLRFDPKVDTSLKVVTLVGNVKSTIEIGTEKERIQPDKSARLILGDRGERDDAQRQRDPYDLSGGLLSHGRVRIFGAEYTSHATAHRRSAQGRHRGAASPRPPGAGRSATRCSSPASTGNRTAATWASIRGPAAHLPVGQHQDEERTIRALSSGRQDRDARPAPGVPARRHLRLPRRGAGRQPQPQCRHRIGKQRGQ